MERRLPVVESPPLDSSQGQVLTALPALIWQLDRDEQYAVIGYFYERRSVWELAGALECHPERVVTLLRTAVRAMRRQVNA